MNDAMLAGQRVTRGAIGGTQITVGTTGQICGPAEDRIALTLTVKTAGRLYIGVAPGTVQTGGCPFPMGTKIIYLTLENAGDLVRRAWYGAAVDETCEVGVIESFLCPCATR